MIALAIATSKDNARSVWKTLVSPRSHLWPFLIIAAVIIGAWAWPVIGDFGHLRLSNPGDSESFAFSLAWNIHAITSFENPFFTPNLYAPGGLDLGNAITVPSVSLLVAPVTVLFGATAGFNAAFLLAIFLGSWSLYLLSRALFGSVIGATVGGALMVVSPYLVGHALGHLNMMLIFGLPLLAYLFVKSVQGRLHWGWFVALTALIMAFTAGASTELLVTQTFFGLVGIIVAYCFAVPAVRYRIVRSTGWLAVGGAIAALAALPIVLAALHAGVPATPGNPPELYSTELTNVVVPTRLVRVLDEPFAAVWPLWLSNDAENTAFIGIPLLIFLAVLAFRLRGRLALGITVFAAVTFIASLGPLLTVAGRQTLVFPWEWISQIPGIDHALPGRFSMFVYMAILLLVAYAWSERRLPRTVTGIAVAATFVLTVPNLVVLGFPTVAQDPPFVTSGELERVVEENDNVLVLPPGQWGPGMRWQTETNFEFRMPTGNGGGAVRPKALDDPVGLALWTQDWKFDFENELPAWLNRNDVDLIIVPTEAEAWNDVIKETLGYSAPDTGGVRVYRPESGGVW